MKYSKSTGEMQQSAPQIIPEQHIFTLLPLPSITDEQEGTANSIMAITIMAILIFTTLDIFICIWKSGDTADTPHHQ